MRGLLEYIHELTALGEGALPSSDRGMGIHHLLAA